MSVKNSYSISITLVAVSNIMCFTSSEIKFVMVSAKQKEIHMRLDIKYECIEISYGTQIFINIVCNFKTK